jgi:hypothetical protein
VLQGEDMDRLHAVLFPPLSEHPRLTIPEVAAQTTALRLSGWSGGAVLPRYADRAALAKHVTSVRLRWEEDGPIFVPEEPGQQIPAS